MDKKSISFADLRTFVMSANQSDIKTLNELIKMRWDSIQAEAASHFIEGDKVSFNAGRKRGVHIGQVEGIVMGFSGRGPRRLVEVKLSTGPMWRVSPSLCTLVARRATTKF